MIQPLILQDPRRQLHGQVRSRGKNLILRFLDDSIIKQIGGNISERLYQVICFFSQPGYLRISGSGNLFYNILRREGKAFNGEAEDLSGRAGQQACNKRIQIAGQRIRFDQAFRLFRPQSMQVFVKEIVVLRSPVCRFQGLKLLRAYHLRKKVVDNAEALRCGKIFYCLMFYQEAEHAFIDKTGRQAAGEHLAGQHPSCGGAFGKALVIKPRRGIRLKLILVTAGCKDKKRCKGPLYEGIGE